MRPQRAPEAVNSCSFATAPSYATAPPGFWTASAWPGGLDSQPKRVIYDFNELQGRRHWLNPVLDSSAVKGETSDCRALFLRSLSRLTIHVSRTTSRPVQAATPTLPEDLFGWSGNWAWMNASRRLLSWAARRNLKAMPRAFTEWTIAANSRGGSPSSSDNCK